MKVHPVEAELFRADGRTDMTELILAFRSFGDAPKTGQLVLYRGIIAVCSDIHTKHINTLWTERRISDC